MRFIVPVLTAALAVTLAIAVITAAPLVIVTLNTIALGGLVGFWGAYRISGIILSKRSGQRRRRRTTAAHTVPIVIHGMRAAPANDNTVTAPALPAPARAKAA